MALLGNYSVILKACGRYLAGSSVSDNRANYNTSGQNRNRYTGQGNFSRPTMDPKSGQPNGGLPPYCWVIPQKTGGMSAYVTVAGSGAITYANLAGGLNGEAPLTGTGDLNAAVLNALGIIAAGLLGDGAVSATADALGNATAPLTGSGDVTTAGANATGNVDGALTGTGDATASIAGALQAAAALTGTGDITTAALNILVEIFGSLTGSGDITASSLLATGNLTGPLTGSGDITASDLRALGNIIGALTGAGALSGTTNASGDMSAAITVTGDLVTASDCANAVWSKALEAGFTADQILRIIAAATAGKVSGGPTSPVFRNLGDTQDQITGEADTFGNRTTATYGD